ncbi:uncharacterized protein LOC129610978 [Condylostylus longicornis]|uniref:uncharacterized protein LOC129610978 n=1 Tax=Condylostylus longicornis TaxID=2530218 RepID=UPI00244E45CA|nr:uncharacterized protein LOC129610978 [Condylostylus longicornis]
MNTKVKNFEFLDLLNLNNNDLKSSVTVPDVILILNSYLKQADTPKDEILLHSITFISNKLLTVFGTDTGLLQLEELFMNLYDIFEIIIDSISRNQRTIKDSKISDFLHNLQIILEKIGEEDELKLSNLSVYIIYGIKFLVKYFSLLKDFECRIDVSEENEMILSTILEQSLGLHSKILSILNENVNLLICQGDDGPLETIEKFLLNLLSITKILVSFNIIACSTTLKFLLKLSIVNSKYFENQIDKNFKWLTDAVKFLCEQVHSLLLQFHNEEFRKGCVNDITKYLKVSLFFIQCMIKVTEHFDVQNIFGFHHIIPVFFEIYRLQSILSSNIHCLIEQYLTANILSLIRIVYKTEDFIGELLKKSHDSIDDSRFCILGIEIIDSLARAKDQYEFSVYFYGQFFKILFEKIPNCVEIFLLQENYIKLEAGMISLWNLYHENLDVMKAFEEILVEGILQYDLKLSKICFDIWIYLARTVNTKSRCHYFEFWRDLHETFPIICYDPKIVSIECLIKVFYDSLPKEYKNDIWSNDNSIDRSRLIYTLGTNSIIDELKRLSLENYFQGKLEENLNLIIEKHNYDYQIYINLVKLFKLVTKSKSFDRNMSRLIMSLIESSCSRTVSLMCTKKKSFGKN